jgi:putative ABC transport system substrate-binding protein
MKRRQFITLLGGVAVAWPLAAHAQQGGRMRRVGVLIGSDDNTEAGALLAEFQQSLEQLGWTYGRNIQIDIRWGSDPERIVAHAKELVRLLPSASNSRTT